MQRVRALAVGSFVLAGGLALATACSPTPPGPFDLEIRSGGVLAFGRDVPASGADPAWNASSIGPTPFLSLGPGSNIEVAFRSPRGGTGFVNSVAGPIATVDEVDLELFARDPEEQYSTFVNAPGSQVRGLLATPRLFPTGEQLWMTPDFGIPSALIIPYSETYPTPVKLGPIDASSFWLTDTFPTQKSSWTAPGSDPLGDGSIKAAYVASHSSCEFRVGIQDIFTQLKTQLPRTLLGGCSGSTIAIPSNFATSVVTTLFGFGLQASVANVALENFGMSSFLKSPGSSPGFAGRTTGGFVVRGDLMLNVDLRSIPFGFPVVSSPCLVSFAYEYTFVLVDGRLNTLVRELRYDDAGGAPKGQVCTAAQNAIRDAFATSIPQQIAQTARDQQSYDFGDLLNGGTTKCTPAETGAAPENCVDAADKTLPIVRVGYALLAGYPDWNSVPPTERSAVEQAWTLGAANLDPQGNWSCVDRAFSAGASTCSGRPVTRQCAISLRASDLVHEPDAVDLKWFGLPTQIPQAKLFYAFLLGLQPSSLGRLCSRRPKTPRGASGTAFNFVNSYFSTSYIKPISCSTLVGRGFAPDRCCESDANCLTQPPGLLRCNLTENRCESAPARTCTSDVGCLEFERCDVSAQRCLRIVQPSPPCPSCPVCDLADPFAPTTCPTGTFCQAGLRGAECRR